jgi:tetratricopeptide (TPR) repeat protein
MYARLSVFPGGFNRQAAMDIANGEFQANGQQREGFANLLNSLVSKSLLRRSDSDRYTLHEVLRQFAAERFGAAPLTTKSRFVRHFAAFLTKQYEIISGLEPASAVKAIQSELANIRRAWGWASELQDSQAIVQGTAALTRYFEMQGPFVDGISLFDDALSYFNSQAAPEAVAELLVARARMQILIGAFEEAISDVKGALEIGDPPQVLKARAHRLWGNALHATGEYEGAVRHFDRAIQSAERHGVTFDSGMALHDKGMVLIDQGHYGEARNTIEIALDTLEQFGDAHGVAIALNALGVVCRRMRDYDAAFDYLTKALDYFIRVENRLGESKSLLNLGVVSRARGNYDAARQYYQRGMELKHALGDRRGESLALNNLGNVAALTGDFVPAITYFQQALLLYKQMGQRRDEAMVMSNLGLLFQLMDNNKEAETYSQMAAQIAGELGDRHTQGYALTHAGHALVALAHLEEAREAYEEALALREFLGETGLAAETKAGLAYVLHLQGDSPNALQLAKQVLADVPPSPSEPGGQSLRLYLNCYQVIKDSEPSRAKVLLRSLWEMLQAQASEYANGEAAYFKNTATHRTILSEARKEGLVNT